MGFRNNISLTPGGLAQDPRQHFLSNLTQHKSHISPDAAQMFKTLNSHHPGAFSLLADGSCRPKHQESCRIVEDVK